MTEAHEPATNDGPHTDGPHEGPIKTPKQLILAILFAFVIPIFGIILLVMFVISNQRPGAGSDAQDASAVAERLQPVGHVEVKDASDLASLMSGEQVYKGQCSTCHAAGLLGAPKFSDTAAWAPRIKAGYEALLKSALGGKGQMPPQGGGDYSDFEIGRAVVYMANKGGASFAEPSPPAATAAASAPETAVALPSAATPTVSAMETAAKEQPKNIVGAVSMNPATTVAAAPVALNTSSSATPPALYVQACSVCHAQGVAGAPKFADKAAWAPRIPLGIDQLTAIAIKGIGAMPPRGGTTASDADIKTVVTYMVNAAK